MLEAKIDNSSNESLLADVKPKANTRNHPAIDRKGKGTRQSGAVTWWLWLLIGNCKQSVLRDSFIQPLSILQVTVAHASVASSKPKVELDSYANMSILGDSYFIIHNHNSPVNVSSYDPKDGDRSAKTVDATVGYQDPQSDQKFILIMNQAIQIDELVNHLLCPMQCCFNRVHITKIHKSRVCSLLPCHPLVHHSTSVKWCCQLLWCIFPKLSKIWTSKYPKDSFYFWGAILGPMNKQIFRTRNSKAQSSRSDQYPCHSSKRTIICQHSCLILTCLWCHWCYG